MDVVELSSKHWELMLHGIRDLEIIRSGSSLRRQAGNGPVRRRIEIVVELLDGPDIRNLRLLLGKGLFLVEMFFQKGRDRAPGPGVRSIMWDWRSRLPSIMARSTSRIR